MPTLLGLDLGTTTITALAVDAECGSVVAKETRSNDAECTSSSDKQRGYSEWDAKRIVAIAIECLRSLADQLTESPCGLGITGQQHGCLLVDVNGQAISPLVNWQDQRCRERYRATNNDYTDEARRRLGPDVLGRCGCCVAHGYMATTLFWWQEQGRLANHSACFLPDFVAAQLTQQPAMTDPTLAASAGVFNVRTGDWDELALQSLGLRGEHFPRVVPCGTRLGLLVDVAAHLRGIPVIAPIGDNQASVFGSLADPSSSVLVNIGTGGQVSAVVPTFQYVPTLETRPYLKGYLLTSAGLAGGRAYAALERFVRQIGTTLFHADETTRVYDALNEWAAAIDTGADGVRCEPFFGGTRVEPTRRATWSGLTFENFTLGHLARSLLEGTAEALATGYETMLPRLSHPRTQLIGAGNGIRENPLLASIIEQRFGLSLRVPHHREEAAYGAALVAGVGLGRLTWDDAGRLIRYR